MQKLTPDGFLARRWPLFIETIRKYSLLFYACGALMLIFAGLAIALLLWQKPGGWEAGILALGFGYLALHAPKHPWVTESTTEAGPSGVKSSQTGRDPLAGDIDPTDSVTKQPAADEGVSLIEAEDPEQTEESQPARE